MGDVGATGARESMARPTDGGLSLAAEEAFRACALDDVRALEALLREKRVPCTIADDKGNTLLHLSCASDALSCAKEVVKACVFAQHPPERAYLTLLNAAGERALDVARACESERCAEWLGRMTGDETRATGTTRAGAEKTSTRRQGRVRTSERDVEDVALRKTRESLVRSLSEALNIASGEDADANVGARDVLREVLSLVNERETLREELEETRIKYREMRSRVQEERKSVVDALGLAEKRAKEMIDERRDEEAEKNALRDALRATSDEFERGRAAGWAAALRLPSREYVRAQMKLEKEASDGAGSSSAAASATGADATAAAFSEISLDEKDVENSSLTERVSNVFKEAFVGVKKRVDQLEKLNRTP